MMGMAHFVAGMNVSNTFALLFIGQPVWAALSAVAAVGVTVLCTTPESWGLRADTMTENGKP